MKTCATVLSLAALSLSFLSMQVIADDKSADKKTNSEVTHHFRTSAIEGMAVRNAAGEDLGEGSGHRVGKRYDRLRRS